MRQEIGDLRKALQEAFTTASSSDCYVDAEEVAYSASTASASGLPLAKESIAEACDVTLPTQSAVNAAMASAVSMAETHFKEVARAEMEWVTNAFDVLRARVAQDLSERHAAAVEEFSRRQANAFRALDARAEEALRVRNNLVGQAGGGVATLGHQPVQCDDVSPRKRLLLACNSSGKHGADGVSAPMASARSDDGRRYRVDGAPALAAIADNDCGTHTLGGGSASLGHASPRQYWQVASKSDGSTSDRQCSRQLQQLQPVRLCGPPGEAPLRRQNRSLSDEANYDAFFFEVLRTAR